MCRILGYHFWKTLVRPPRLGTEESRLDPTYPLTCPSVRLALTQAIAKACAKRGMLLMTAGARECVRFLPPLSINARECDLAIEVFGQALDEVLLGV